MSYSNTQKALPAKAAASKKRQPKGKANKQPVQRKTFAGTRRMLYDDEIAEALAKLSGLDPKLLILPFATVAQFKMYLTDDPKQGNMLQLRLAGTDMSNNEDGGNANSDVSHVERVVFIVNPTEDLQANASSAGKEGGIHWLAVLIDIPTKEVLVVDPLKLQQSNGEEEEKNDYDESEGTFSDVIVQELKEVFESQIEPFGSPEDEYTIGDRMLGVQRDSFNCGIWCLDIVAEYARVRNLDAISTDMFRRAKGTRKYKEFKDSRRNFWASVIYEGQPAFVRPGGGGRHNANNNARRASLRAQPTAAAAASGSSVAAASSPPVAAAAAAASAAPNKRSTRANQNKGSNDNRTNSDSNNSGSSRKKPKRNNSRRNVVDLTE
jgi:hypothetical protein